MSNGIKSLNPDNPRSLQDMEYLERWAKSMGKSRSELYQALSELERVQSTSKPLMFWSPSRGRAAHQVRVEGPKLTPDMKSFIDKLGTKKEWLKARNRATMGGIGSLPGDEEKVVLKTGIQRLVPKGAGKLLSVLGPLGAMLGLAFDQATAADELGAGEDEILRQLKMGRDN
jgi:hypothetical protein|tara:strand:- start:3957 stop:4472 length:516 start_codon:yes stop_codon:yes gene_type:complete